MLKLRRIVPVIVLASWLGMPLSDRASAQSASRLQPLLNDTVAHFKIVYRHDETEMRRRYMEVSKVLAAWREADRTEENNLRLEDWLRGTIRSSMPGSHAELPSMPTFENLPAPTLPATRAPEHSLLPASAVGELPTPTTLRTPASNVPITPPQADANIQPADVEANKPSRWGNNSNGLPRLRPAILTVRQ